MPGLAVLNPLELLNDVGFARHFIYFLFHFISLRVRFAHL